MTYEERARSVRFAEPFNTRNNRQHLTRPAPVRRMPVIQGVSVRLHFRIGVVEQCRSTKQDFT